MPTASEIGLTAKGVHEARQFRERNFALTSELVEMPNGGTRSERSVDMTRDGFVFIAFGFTGKCAAKFKEGYIAASSR